MTSKELAKLLNVSTAAVSLAMNNKPGISTKMRNKILDAAMEHGMDVPEKEKTVNNMKTIYVLHFQPTIFPVPQVDFEEAVIKGIETYGHSYGYNIYINHVADAKMLQAQLSELEHMKNCGAIIFGTAMSDADFYPMSFTKLPIVLLDNYTLTTKFDSILIDNVGGAYTAVNYLIHKRKCVPGYLRANIALNNFYERQEGFEKALVHNGFSRSSYPRFEISASTPDAYNDMMQIIKEEGKNLPNCFFADCDYVALGAIKALLDSSLRVPEDVSVVGFDDLAISELAAVPLTTVHVPKHYFGRMAAQRLIQIIEDPEYYPVTIRVSTNLVVRKSV